MLGADSLLLRAITHHIRVIMFFHDFSQKSKKKRTGNSSKSTLKYKDVASERDHFRLIINGVGVKDDPHMLTSTDVLK